MTKFNLIDIASNHISNLSGHDFIHFCDQLLSKLFPKDSVISASISQNGYTIIDDNLFSVIPEKSFIKNSISSLQSVQSKSISKVVFLTKPLLGNEPKLKSFLKVKFKGVITEFWGINSIKQKLADFSIQEIYDLIGKDSTFTSYFQISPEEEFAFSYYKEIFDFIMSNYQPSQKLFKPSKDNKKYARIDIKIPLNFSAVQDRVWEMYRNTYPFNNLAEKFIQERYKSDYDFKIGIQEEIHSSFCTIARAPRHNYPVNDFIVLEEMAKKCLKIDYKEHPQLLRLARGIIIYFFEICEFGARNVEEQNEFYQPSFFTSHE